MPSMPDIGEPLPYVPEQQMFIPQPMEYAGPRPYIDLPGLIPEGPLPLPATLPVPYDVPPLPMPVREFGPFIPPFRRFLRRRFRRRRRRFRRFMRRMRRRRFLADLGLIPPLLPIMEPLPLPV